MKYRQPAFALITSAFLCVTSLSTASAQDEPPPPKAPPAATETPPKNSESDKHRMDCDMKGKDMSKMSAEEHKKMMEKCKAQRQKPGKEDGDHRH